MQIIEVPATENLPIIVSTGSHNNVKWLILLDKKRHFERDSHSGYNFKKGAIETKFARPIVTNLLQTELQGLSVSAAT